MLIGGLMNLNAIGSNLEWVQEVGRHVLLIERLMEEQDVGLVGGWMVIGNSSSDYWHIATAAKFCLVRFNRNSSSRIIYY